MIPIKDNKLQIWRLWFPQSSNNALYKTRHYCYFYQLPNWWTDSSKEIFSSLSSKNNIIILSSEKGGSVVVMDSSVYNQKLVDLLDDNNTYEQISQQTI